MYINIQDASSYLELDRSKIDLYAMIQTFYNDPVTQELVWRKERFEFSECSEKYFKHWNDFEKNYISFWKGVLPGLHGYCLDDFDDRMYIKGNLRSFVERQDSLV